MSERSYGLAGGVALVTGAGQGIGEAVALALAKEGVAVAVNGRSRAKLDRVVAEIVAAGGRALAVPARVERADEVAAMTAATIAEFGRVDYLVNNAGISRPAAFLDLSEEDWDANIDINLKGAFLVSQAVARHMVAKKRGAIVNLCSIASFGGQEGRAGYCASKAGLLGLTRVMAVELAARGVRVNAVAPGLIGTEMISRNIPESFLDEIILDRKPMGRLGKPNEVAEAILFLLSEGASYLTGAILPVDGGLLSGYFHSNRSKQAAFRR